MTLDDLSKVAMGSIGSLVPFGGDGDPFGAFHFFKGAYTPAPPFAQGIVTTYNPNTHTARVLVSGTQSEWTCVFSDEMLSLSFGYSAIYPVRDGELVLVRQVASGVRAGIIIGRIPYPVCFSKGDIYNDPDKYHRSLFTQNPDTGDRNIPGMMKPLQAKNDNSTHLAFHLRPTDVYPGEFAHVNQHNCGIKGGLFSATLLGGGASLRLSALSNLARLTCESYQRHSMLGSLLEFHNGRYLSSERNLSMFQEERLGWYKKDNGEFSSNVWTTDSAAPKGGENQTSRPRIKELSGYFGHLISQFCLRPDPSDSKVRVQGESKPKEEGVCRKTVDPSGQVRISAAGMLALERTGRIPVPVRKAYPTDNGHDIDWAPEKLTPFRHSEEDPNYRQLELYDRQAYDLKNQYARVDSLGNDNEARTDYDVPQEEDLKPLNDEYDKEFSGSRTVDLKKYDKRRAGVYIGEDGSVIVRDAWGSEIVMMGGNVTIACAGNVMTMPGQTALTIAGDDIVQKAQNSVDIHASAHDVRLSAARNMEILGGGDENKFQGGVLIESRGKGVAPWDGTKGEEARLTGIAIRSKNQGIVLDGNILNLRSRKDTRIISGDKELDGNISMAAKMVRSRAKSMVMSSDEGKAHLILNKNSFQAVADSIGIFSEINLTLLKGSKYPVPLMWRDMNNIAEELKPAIDETTEDLKDEDTASAGFSHKNLEKMIFGFRKSVECRTDKSWSIGGSGKFKLYEPAWVQVMKVYETLKNGEVDSKVYEEKAEWETKERQGGLPFPGKPESDDEQGMYAQLKGLQPPENLTSEGFNKSRKKVKDRSEIEEIPLKDGYRVRSFS